MARTPDCLTTKETWNVAFVQDRFRQANVLLVERAWRERGFVVDAANPLHDGWGHRLRRRLTAGAI